MADPHGPNTLEDYIRVHERHMARFLEAGFVLEDGCVFTPYKTEVKLDGIISCRSGIQLEVQKDIGYVNGSGRRAKVQTKAFRYQSWLTGVGNILRYEWNYDHRGIAHKHVYDTLGTGREISVQELTSTHEVPHLDDVINELRDWRDTYRLRLAD
jgi:hypothetical protein